MGQKQYEADKTNGSSYFDQGSLRSRTLMQASIERETIFEHLCSTLVLDVEVNMLPMYLSRYFSGFCLSIVNATGCG